MRRKSWWKSCSISRRKLRCAQTKSSPLLAEYIELRRVPTRAQAMRKSVADGTAEPEPQTPQQKRAALLAKKTNDLKAAAAKRQEEYKAKMQALKDRGGTVMETMKLTKEGRPRCK